jgi:uncharacterized protein YeaO (DUF488 family)
VILTKRAYDPPSASDGPRFLVDRLWPRGMKKEALKMDAWLKDLAPSDELRKWSHHDPERWPEFRKRYAAELAAHPECWKPLLDRATEGTVTLLYSAHDTERNNAIALKLFLEAKLKRKAPMR